jgi:epoxyqueuosine reductase
LENSVLFYIKSKSEIQKFCKQVETESQSYNYEKNQEGYKATIVPTEGSEFGYWYAERETLKANLSIKYAAYHAGLGNFGMNHLLITKDLGPRVRMTTIFTDAPLEKEEKDNLLPFINEKCSSCMKCIEICPAGAISKNGTINRQKCAQYMFNVLEGLRCGLCVKVFPQ